MSRSIKHSLETRIEANRLFDAGFGYRAVTSLLGIPLSTSRSWNDRYRQAGLLGLVPMSKGRRYSQEVKVAAVEAFLAGESSAKVVERFKLSNRSLLNKWVAVFRAEGIDGLTSTKVGRKPQQQRPETMEEEIARLRMENAVLKKFAALMSEGDSRTAKKSGLSPR